MYGKESKNNAKLRKFSMQNKNISIKMDEG